MKKYYMKQYLNFRNAYNLAYAETPVEEKIAAGEGYEQITRKQAEKLCAEEKERRKHDQSFSGFADNFILPIGYDDYWPNDRNMVKNGYIIERITRQ